MRLFRVFSIVTLVTVMALVLAGCSKPSSPAAAPLELVPQGNDFVAKIKVSQLLNDPELTALLAKHDKSGDGMTMEKSLEQFQARTGIDPKSITSLVLFGEVDRAEQDKKPAGIVTGTFDKGTVIAAIEAHLGDELDTDEYKGFTIYADNSGPQQRAIVFLKDDLLAFGNVQQVESVVDVHTGDAPALSGVVADAYNKLGDPSIKLAFIPAEETFDKLSDSLAQSPVDIQSILDIRVLGFAVDSDGQNVTLDIKALYATSDDADGAKTKLKALQLVAPNMPAGADVSHLLAVVSDASISTDGAWLSINAEMSLEELEALHPETQ